MILKISINRKTGEEISREFIDDGKDHSGAYNWYVRKLAEKMLEELGVEKS